MPDPNDLLMRSLGFSGPENTLKRGITSGMVQNPFIRAAFRALPFVGADELDEFVAKMESDPDAGSLQNIGRFVGRYGPDLYAVGKTFSFAEGLAVSGLQKAAPKILEKATASRIAGSNTLATQASKVIAKSKDYPGLLHPSPMPGLQRATMTAGRSVGIGGVFGAETALEGGDLGEIASSALKGAALTAALEGVLIGAGSLLTNHASKVGLQEAVDWFNKGGGPGALQTEVGALREKFLGAQGQVAKTRLALEHQRQVHKQALEIESQMPASVLRKGRQKTGIGKLKKLEAQHRKQTQTAAQTKHAWEVFREDMVKGGVIPTAIKQVKPYNPQGGWLEFQQAMLGSKDSAFAMLSAILPKTIEDFAGRLGFSGTKAVRGLMQAEADSAIAKAGIDSNLKLLMNKMAGEMKVKPGDGMFAQPVFELAEKEGIGAVRTKYGHTVAGLVNDTKTTMQSRYGELAKMGAEPMMTETEFFKSGVKEYFPHVLRDMNDNALRNRMLEGVKRTLKKRNPNLSDSALNVESQNLVARMVKNKERGLEKFGSIEHQRVLGGSLGENILNGIPFESNPFIAMSRYMSAVERRVAFGNRFGFKGELQEPIIRSVAAEGGSEALMTTIMDAFYARPYHSQFSRRLAQNFNNTQIVAKLTFAAIPNMGQSSNTLAFTGFRNTARGFEQIIKREGIHNLDRQTALADGMFQSLRRTDMGGIDQLNWLDRLVDREMKWTFFTTSERVNRMVGGASTGQMVLSDLGQALTGRLRGKNLDIVRRRFEKVDLDLDGMVRRLKSGGRIAESEIDRAIYKGSQYTQFIPDMTRRPLWWNTPVGRVATQFHSFVLGQYNFLRNHILAEAAQGNAMPLATVLAVYPIVGEAIGDTVSALKDRKRPRDPVMRVIDNFSLVGGLGIVTTLYDAVKYERAPQALLGPTGGDILDFAQNLFKAVVITPGNTAALERQGRKQPVIQGIEALLRVGDATADTLMGLVEGETETTTLDQMRFNQTQRKR